MTSPPPPSSKNLRLAVPANTAIAVEHPCLVKNVEKAIDSVGGGPAITQALEVQSDKTFALSFNPQDPAAPTILANKRQANNVLLRIVVPKRTGRKRRKGSQDPWISNEAESPPRRDASYLARSMNDNPDRHSVRAVAQISSTHIWRRMPDLAYSTKGTKVLEDVKSQILSQSYSTIKQFKLPKTHGVEDTTALPPVIWSNQAIPFNYTYRQNPAVRLLKDPVSGKNTVVNTQSASKLYVHQVQWDTPEYPTEPMTGIPTLEESSEMLRTTTEALRVLFDERPIWTRRALLNCLETELTTFNVVRYCLAYVAYAVRSGPWRDTYVKLGVDPRKDVGCRFYQTIMLQLVPKQFGAGRQQESKYTSGFRHGRKNHAAPDGSPDSGPPLPERQKITKSRETYSRFWARSDNPTSHIFSGNPPLPPDGKVWQLCDITDFQIAGLRDTSPEKLRSECETRYFGWYWEGTAAKMKVALKTKVDALMENRVFDPSVFEPILGLPDQLPSTFSRHESTVASMELPEKSATPSTESMLNTAEQTGKYSELYLSNDATKDQLEWAGAYRSYMKSSLCGSKDAQRGSRPRKAQVTRPKVARAKRPSGEATVNPAKATPGIQEHSTDPLDQASITGQVFNTEETGDLPESGSIRGSVEIFPSIEVDGYDEQQDSDDDLGLDVDIKLEADPEDIDMADNDSADTPTESLGPH